MYGQCLRRVIHSIHDMRLRHPSVAIYLFKYDFEAAYRRLHVLPSHAVLTIITLNNLAYLLTRLPFGATCGPSEYGEIGEAIFDTANDLIADKSWNPQKLHSPHKEKLQRPEKLPDSIPFTKAKPLEVELPE